MNVVLFAGPYRSKSIDLIQENNWRSHLAGLQRKHRNTDIRKTAWKGKYMKNIMVTRALELVSLGGFLRGMVVLCKIFLFVLYFPITPKISSPENLTGKGNTDSPISVEGPDKTWKNFFLSTEN